MGRLGKKFEEIMSAIAFAEAGEFDAARQMEGRSSVLLVLRGVESERNSLKFALNISRRIGAGLDVLYVSAQKGISDLLKALEGEAERTGVKLRVERKSGCIKKEILDYTESRSDIRFVVVESAETIEADCGGRMLAEGWEKLRCPLVVVSDAV